MTLATTTMARPPFGRMLTLRRCCCCFASRTNGCGGGAGTRPPAIRMRVGPAWLSSASAQTRSLSGGGLLFPGRWSTATATATATSSSSWRSLPVRADDDMGAILQARCYSRNSQHDNGGASSSSSSSSKNSAEQHTLFLEQLSELNHERETLFGRSPAAADGDLLDYSEDDIQLTAERVIREASSLQPIVTTDVHENDDDKSTVTTATTRARMMETLKNERQELYGFTEQEELSWSSAGGTHKHTVEFLQEIEQARRDVDKTLTAQQSNTHNIKRNSLDEKNPPLPATRLTHVADDGQSVHMVDVGTKVATRRTATAETIVVFPDEVLEAFGVQHPNDSGSNNNNELIGPKGPIFSTATLAGIMAAKQTSNLIPLCHPLPLEQVTIDIEWRTRNSIAIQCCCRVTHKTGVEMEALTGATIAALTVYDMVKAVSHNVEIRQTRLLHKDGGRRRVDRKGEEDSFRT